VVKGLTANCRESFFLWRKGLVGNLVGRIGFTLDLLCRLPFGRKCRTEVEAGPGRKKKDNVSCWSFD